MASQICSATAMRTTSLGSVLCATASESTLSRDPHGAYSTSMQASPSGWVVTPSSFARCGCFPRVTNTSTSRSSSACPRPRTFSSATVTAALPSARHHSARKTDLKDPAAIGRSSTVSEVAKSTRKALASGRRRPCWTSRAAKSTPKLCLAALEAAGGALRASRSLTRNTSEHREHRAASALPCPGEATSPCCPQIAHARADSAGGAVAATRGSGRGCPAAALEEPASLSSVFTACLSAGLAKGLVPATSRGVFPSSFFAVMSAPASSSARTTSG
mmetsp:Transcript_54922/g.130416  ORF Transcript_54922/g.130416 Transcript_54922/m.130416 type:complete len:275 (+) Transcript_54922:824-1648(+)